MFTSLYSFFRIFYDALLDTLFPLSARASRVRAYTPDALHATPQTHTAFGMKILTLTRYRECAIEDSIHALKYEKSIHAAHLLSGLLTDYLIDTLSELSLFSNKEVVLIPMPLFHTRKRARGYNQIQLVLEQPSIQDLAVTIRPDLLKRTRDTPPQTKLSRHERLRNVKEAFETQNGVDYTNMHIFLIDDVTTTGATLREAAHALEKVGAKVTPLAFARA